MSRRACDRCYAIKARCVYGGLDKNCERCTRLDHKCETIRAILSCGRPRKAQKSRTVAIGAIQAQTVLSKNISFVSVRRETRLAPSFEDFTRDELNLIEFLLHPDQIACLVYGQTFRDQLRTALMRQLLSATNHLKDAFVAFADALLSIKQGSPTDQALVLYDDRDLRALRTLGNLEATTLLEARTTLALALALITYNDLSVGAPTLPVSQSALLKILPWRDQLIGQTNSTMDPNIICLLFTEMFECLIHCASPVFRYQVSENNQVIDRYYGICHDLLPHLYDICSLYQSIKTGLIAPDNVDSIVAELCQAVDRWLPEQALESRGEMLANESETRRRILLQAKVYKSAVHLLLLQAQRTLAGDLLAHSKAIRLMSQISDATENGVNGPRYMLFPYFVACLELYGKETDIPKVVQKTTLEISSGMAPRSSQSMLVCLQHVLTTRRLNPNLTWFQCVDPGLSFAMGP